MTKHTGILVTGPAGSGTTWMMNYLDKMGWSHDHEKCYMASEFKGHEFIPLLNLKREIEEALREYLPVAPRDARSVHHHEVIDWCIEWARPRIDVMEVPWITKVPGLGLSGVGLLPTLPTQETN